VKYAINLVDMKEIADPIISSMLFSRFVGPDSPVVMTSDSPDEMAVIISKDVSEKDIIAFLGFLNTEAVYNRLKRPFRCYQLTRNGTWRKPSSKEIEELWKKTSW
jgi:phosphoribosyl-AMP cyclohydrolase